MMRQQKANQKEYASLCEEGHGSVLRCDQYRPAMKTDSDKYEKKSLWEM